MSFAPISTLKRDFVYISQHDPAIDTESESFDFEAYLDSGDTTNLPLKPAHTLTVFHLKKLPPQVYGDCSFLVAQAGQDQSMMQRAWLHMAKLALKHGLKKVDNWPELELPTETDDSGKQVLTDDAVESIWAANTHLFLELGMVLFQESSGLKSGSKKK